MKAFRTVTVRTATASLRRTSCRTFAGITNNKSAIDSSFRKHIGSGVWSSGSLSHFSTQNDKEEPAKELAPIVVYEGAYCTKLRCLRVVSFTSSIFCTVGLPLGLAFTGMAGSVPFVGQVLIASTAIFISLSSTAFLQLVTHPYTVILKEIPQKLNDGEIIDPKNRLFRATRIGVYGQMKETEFTLNDAARITTSAHPFASVKIKGNFFYIFGRHIQDVPLRHALTNEQ